MATENDQLKEEAQRQYVTQRLDELRLYIERLFADADKAYALYRRGDLLMSATFVTYLLSSIASVWFSPGIWGEANRAVANLLFWIIAGRHWLFTIPFFLGSKDEINGCMKTLEILGMLDKSGDGSKRLKKYKESLTAKLWDALKRKTRERAYQPA